MSQKPNVPDLKTCNIKNQNVSKYLKKHNTKRTFCPKDEMSLRQNFQAVKPQNSF